MILKGGVTVEIQNHDCTRPQRPQTLRSVHIGQKIFSRKTSVVFKTLIGKRNEMSDIRLGPRGSTEKPLRFAEGQSQRQTQPDDLVFETSVSLHAVLKLQARQSDKLKENTAYHKADFFSRLNNLKILAFYGAARYKGTLCTFMTIEKIKF